MDIISILHKINNLLFQDNSYFLEQEKEETETKKKVEELAGKPSV